MRTSYMKMRDAFVKFDKENPDVWQYFLRFVKQLQDRGYRHFGVAAIIERIRWEVALETRSADGFKVCNNHRAFYARKYQKQFPEWDGFFLTKTQKSKSRFIPDEDEE